MKTLPEAVSVALAKLKRQYQFYVTVKKINGKYYLYRQFGAWDKIAGRTKITSEYLGKLAENGSFVKKRALVARYPKDTRTTELNLEAGAGLHANMKKKRGIMDFELPSTRDLELLTILSTDARTPVSTIAKRVGLGTYAARSRIKKLERELNLKYTLELDITKLGYLPYIIFIKFGEKQPQSEEFEKILKEDLRIQFCVWAKGDYDLVVYALYENQVAAFDNMHRLRRSTSGYYDSTWYITPFAQTYSFIPLRKEFVENVLKTKEWHKTKEHTSPRDDELKHREFIIIKELNENSTKNLTDIEKEYGLGRGMIINAYSSLRERGIIVRPTAYANTVPIKYIGMISLKIVNVAETYATWEKRITEYISNGLIFNKYSLIGYIGSPDSALVFMPVFNMGDMEKAKDYLQNTSPNGHEISTTVITKIIVGSLCIRRLDNRYSRFQNVLYKLKKFQSRGKQGREKLDDSLVWAE